MAKGNSSSSVKAFNPINLTGNFQDLVIFVAFPDRPSTQNWPTLNTSAQYPLLGAFPDGTLLKDYVIANNNSIPIDEWYKPALDSYFNDISGGVYNVNFTFLKQANGKPYQTDHGMDYWKSKCPSCNWTQETPVIFYGNNWNEITSEVIENIWEDNNNAFQNIDAIHFVFWGLPKTESGYGTVFPNKTFTHSNGQILLQGIEVSTQPSPQPIPHERLHLIGYISGNPSGFTGFRDRGSDRSIGGVHFNMTASHDMVDHSNRGIPALHSLYGWHPMTSLDLVFLGWIKPDEVLNVNKNNFSTLQQIKLADMNFPLSQQEINSGYRRVIKVMIKENFIGDLDEYFLLEYHKASLYDKNFTNFDEFINGYGKGILVWHIKENTSMYSWSSDHYIDLEAAVPYNGWFGNPIPNDSYPRNYNRPNNWNGIYSKDYDYMDDMQRYKAGGISYWSYPPDGGRHIWETTIIPTPSIHLIGRPFSIKSDFFTDESIKGIVTNKMSDITRPSTREWGNVTIALKTHIGFLNMKREHDYMTLDIEYNYWEGDIEENSTMSGNLTIASDVIVPSGKILTISPGTNITFLNGADLIINGTLNSSVSLIIPDNSELKVSPGATLRFAAGKSLTVNGNLNATGATFTSVSSTWGGIKFNSGSNGIIDGCEINNVQAYGGYAIDIFGGSPTIENSTIQDNTGVCGGIGVINNGFPYLYNNVIKNNSYHGIYIYNTSAFLRFNTITSSTATGRAAVYCDYYATPLFAVPSGGYEEGKNTLQNGYYGLYGNYYSLINAGTSSNGYHNRFINNSYANVYAANNTTIYAGYDWWGVPYPNKYYAVSGSVIYPNPPLSSDPGPGASIVVFDESDKQDVSLSKASIQDNDLKKNIAGLISEYRKTKDKSLITYVKQFVDNKTDPDTVRPIAMEVLSNIYLIDKNISEVESLNKLLIKDYQSTIHEKNGKMNLFFIYYDSGNYKEAKQILASIDKSYSKNNEVMLANWLISSESENEIENYFSKEQMEADDAISVKEYSLFQNYPNPFNPSTTISYNLPFVSEVEVTIYDILGNKVKSFVITAQNSGTQKIIWNGRNSSGEQVASGIYLYHFKAKSLEKNNEVFEKTAKLILMK